MEPGRWPWSEPAEEQRERVHGMPEADECQESVLQVRPHRLSAARRISKARGIGGVLGVEQSGLRGRRGMEGGKCRIADIGSNADKVVIRIVTYGCIVFHALFGFIF